MTVRDLIIKLLEYNLDADINPRAHNVKQDFSMSYRGADGCDKQSCTEVFIDCDNLNQYESG